MVICIRDIDTYYFAAIELLEVYHFFYKINKDTQTQY